MFPQARDPVRSEEALGREARRPGITANPKSAISSSSRLSPSASSAEDPGAAGALSFTNDLPIAAGRRCLPDAVRCAGEVSSFQTGVIVDAYLGEQREPTYFWRHRRGGAGDPRAGRNHPGTEGAGVGDRLGERVVPIPGNMTPKFSNGLLYQTKRNGASGGGERHSARRASGQVTACTSR